MCAMTFVTLGATAFFPFVDAIVSFGLDEAWQRMSLQWITLGVVLSSRCEVWLHNRFQREVRRQLLCCSRALHGLFVGFAVDMACPVCFTTGADVDKAIARIAKTVAVCILVLVMRVNDQTRSTVQGTYRVFRA